MSHSRQLSTHSILSWLLRSVPLVLLAGALLACAQAAAATATPTPPPAAVEAGQGTPAAAHVEAAQVRPPSPPPTYTATPTGDPPVVPTLTATPVATDTPTPTATPSPTATPTATSTPLPAVADLLAEAERFLRNGDYDTAAGAFQVILDAFPGQPIASEAAFGRGRSFLLDGRVAEAVAALAPLHGGVFAETRPEAYFWLGRAHAAQGQAEQAAAAFAAYAGREPVLAHAAFEAAGRAFLNVLDAANAIRRYEQALAAAPDLVSALRAREGIAEAGLLAGDPAAAIRQYETILEVARNAGYRTTMLYRLGRAHLAAGDETSAYATFHRATQTDPNNSFAYLSLVELVSAGQPVDDLLRGRINLAAGSYHAAIQVLYRYLDAAPDHDGEGHALVARAYEGLSNYQQADVEWRQIIETHPGDPLVGEAWLGRGRSLWRLGNTIAAREVYLQGADNSPDQVSASACLWWAGILAEREEATMLAAAEIYLRLAREFPASAYASQAAFRGGLTYYRLGDLHQAEAIWAGLAGSGRELWHAGADFWLGKILAASGHQQEALAHWQAVAQRWGSSNFYGVRAAQIVAGETGADLPFDDPEPAPGALPELNAWLRTWTTAALPDDWLAPMLSFIAPTWQHQVGEAVTARSGFEALRNQWSNNPVALLRLALYTRELGYYDTSIRAAARVAALSPTPLPRTPRVLQELMYPLYFDDLIVPAALNNDIEPQDFFALIRQESLFGATATSTAAARGLSQIIPSTGRSIAQQLNWPNYRDELLYRPYVNVHFGAFYLGQGLRSSGNLYQALAGYNGGPGNAAFWRRQSGLDDDLYVELVSFTETQTYLRTITVQAQHYRRLYPDLSTLPATP